MGLVVDTSAVVALERAEVDWAEALGDEGVAVQAIVYADPEIADHYATRVEKCEGVS